MRFAAHRKGEAATAGGMQGDRGRVAVNDRARQIELLAKPGPQAGRAHALGSDDRILLQHERVDAGARGFASGRTARGTAPHDQELDVAHAWPAFARKARISAWKPAFAVHGQDCPNPVPNAIRSSARAPRGH